MERLDEQLVPYIESYNDQKDGSIREKAKYTDDFVNALRAYYLDPCLDTFDNTLQVAFDIVDNVSSSLAVSMLSHGRDIENEISSSMALRAVSPVEVSAKERALVFGG